MTIYLFAGTNGCGKSTVLVDYIRIHKSWINFRHIILSIFIKEIDCLMNENR